MPKDNLSVDGACDYMSDGSEIELPPQVKGKLEYHSTPATSQPEDKLKLILHNYNMRWNYAIEMRNPKGAEKAEAAALTAINTLIDQRVREAEKKAIQEAN